MACVPKIAVVLFTIIAAEWCDASSERGRFPPWNPWRTFWNQHCFLWTLRTSDSLTLPCKREERRELNDTGVTLQESHNLYNKTTGANYSWRFGDDGAMYYYVNESDSDYGVWHEFDVKAVLEYQDSTNNCSVVRYEQWMYVREEGKQFYEKQCQDRNLQGCMCNDTQSGMHPYACRHIPFYELVSHDAPTENAPEDCKQYYDTHRVQYRTDDTVVYTKGCENAPPET